MESRSKKGYYILEQNICKFNDDDFILSQMYSASKNDSELSRPVDTVHHKKDVQFMNLASKTSDYVLLVFHDRQLSDFISNSKGSNCNSTACFGLIMAFKMIRFSILLTRM